MELVHDRKGEGPSRTEYGKEINHSDVISLRGTQDVLVGMSSRFLAINPHSLYH